ncbi:MAG: hypothetical protein QOG83_1666 [Alphaproteobacteria bacterium]|nr:hypothetical protein [Alphaproteobacteria bacterium]
MSNVVKGLIAGLVATLVLTGLMVLNGAFGLMPEINIIRWLTALGTLSVPSAWMDHFIVGVVIWGMLFAAYDSIASRPALWIKGLIFGVFAWAMMMVSFMPLAGAGFFGAKIDNSALLGLLALHLVYGLVLATTYGFLGAMVPVRAPVTLQEEELAVAGGTVGPNAFTMNSADINDHLPSSSPSAKTVLIIFGSLAGFFALLVLLVEFRTKLGF